MTRHRTTDATEPDSKVIRKQEEQYVETLDKQLQKMRSWLEENEYRKGSRGTIVKSNITDNESAKMKTSKGIIQGYNGVAMVDSKNQIIVAAETYGHNHEQAVLDPMISHTRNNFQEISGENDIFDNARLTGDSDFHSEKNMAMLADQEIDAYIADPKFRSRDPRFDHSGRYKLRDQKERKRRNPKRKSFHPIILFLIQN